MHRRPFTRLLAFSAALLSGLPGLAQTSPSASFTFAAFGCMPYQRSGGNATTFGRLIAEVNRHSPAFSVHLGDLLGSDEKCTDELLLQRRDAFNTFTGPLIYTPGDNEWTDVHYEKAGRLSPSERLAKIRSLFFSEERSLGLKPIPLVTQRHDSRFSKFVENARWTHNRVVFATVHVVGSHNNHQASVPGAMEEWRERDAANEAWIRATFAEAKNRNAPGVAFFFQADPFAEDHGKPGYDDGFELFLKTMEEEARAFAKPVLLVHADEHRYRLNFGMRFQATAEPVPNVTRLETFGAANLHAVLVTVDPDSIQVFAPGPLIVPGNPLPLLPRAKAAAQGTDLE